MCTSPFHADCARSEIDAPSRRDMLRKLTALGLTLPQTYRFVLLPMAFRIVLPPLTSEFMNVIKNSSVALTIGLVELTAAARSMQGHERRTA